VTVRVNGGLTAVNDGRLTRVACDRATGNNWSLRGLIGGDVAGQSARLGLCAFELREEASLLAVELVGHRHEGLLLGDSGGSGFFVSELLTKIVESGPLLVQELLGGDLCHQDISVSIQRSITLIVTNVPSMSFAKNRWLRIPQRRRRSTEVPSCTFNWPNSTRRGPLRYSTV